MARWGGLVAYVSVLFKGDLFSFMSKEREGEYFF